MPSLSTQPVQAIRDIFTAAVAAADPYQSVFGFLHKQYDSLLHSSLQPPLFPSQASDWRRVHILAFGKAAAAMTQAALDVVPLHYLVDAPLAITHYDAVQPITHCQVIGAGHPIPDASGLAAAKLVAARAAAAQAGELVLVLISGGGSALLPLPVDGITLTDKIAVTQLLLACGANINEINCVRKHLSQFKGGGLMRLAAPAALHALILSDVIGDDVSAIASGPTVPDPTTFADALAILQAYQLWPVVPMSVQQYICKGVAEAVAETPKPGAAIFEHCSHTLIGSNALSVAAAAQAAKEYGCETTIYSHALCGEARLAAEALAAHAKNLQQTDIISPLAVIAGGETTVTLGDQPCGKGGRNQELALAFALAAEQLALGGRWWFLSGGTDGRDGPTDAAGGVVDATTLAKMRAAGVTPEEALQQHDAYTALRAADALLKTGATGTNVADLQILLLYPND